MNNINNIFNKNEIENKLKNFQEGKDYSVSPTEEPNVKTYNFHNDKLRSVFRNDRVPVRITQEAYDGKDYTYRGHFEEGKDYSYYCKTWQGVLPADENGWRPISEIMWKSGNGDYTKGSIRGWKLGNKSEPLQYLPHNLSSEESWHLTELKAKHNNLVASLNSLLIRPESDFGVNGKEKKEFEIAQVKKHIADIEREIKNSGHFYCGKCGIKHDNPRDKVHNCVEKINNSDLIKENHELRQQLSVVQKQLAEVLTELKKLKNNSTGKDTEKLNQQIVQNERLIESGSAVSEVEVRDQINKSEALMKEFNTTVSPVNDNKKDNGSLPYVIGGSVILASAGIIGYCLLKKNRKGKVA